MVVYSHMRKQPLINCWNGMMVEIDTGYVIRRIPNCFPGALWGKTDDVTVSYVSIKQHFLDNLEHPSIRLKWSAKYAAETAISYKFALAQVPIHSFIALWLMWLWQNRIG